MNNNNVPRDLLSSQNAAPVERAEIQADQFTGANHAPLPGVPADEPYMIGDELNRIDQGQFNQGVTMGGLSASDLYPVVNPFPDQVPTYDTMGYPSQQGINTGALPISMSGDKMYWDGVQNEVVGFHQVGNVQPELQGYHPTVNQGPGSTDE